MPKAKTTQVMQYIRKCKIKLSIYACSCTPSAALERALSQPLATRYHPLPNIPSMLSSTESSLYVGDGPWCNQLQTPPKLLFPLEVAKTVDLQCRAAVGTNGRLDARPWTMVEAPDNGKSGRSWGSWRGRWTWVVASGRCVPSTGCWQYWASPIDLQQRGWDGASC